MYIYDKLTLRFLADNDAKYGCSWEEFMSLKITAIRPPEEVPSLLKFHEAMSEEPVDAGRWLHQYKEGQPF